MAVDFHRARPGRRKPDEKPGWRERARALKYIPRLLRLVWQTHRGYASAMVALRLVRAFIPVATLWIGKLIIDAVVAMRESAPDFRRLWQLVAMEGAIVLLGEGLA